jgi:hypothetical protein
MSVEVLASTNRLLHASAFRHIQLLIFINIRKPFLSIEVASNIPVGGNTYQGAHNIGSG